MSLSNQQLHSLCDSLHDEVIELNTDLMSKDYEILMLTHTISVLQDAAVKDFDSNKLKVAALQNKLDKRVLQ